MNWRCKAFYQILNDIFIPGHSKKLFFIFIVKFSDSFTCRFKSILINDSIRNQIQMSFIHTGYFSCSLHHLLLLDSIYSHNLYSITWFNNIDIIIISDHSNCMWSFTLWHVLRELLKLNELLICEFAKIMNDLEAVSWLTFFTNFRFLNFSIFKCYSVIFITFYTSKKCSFHFRYYIRCSYDDTSERYETIDLFFTDISHDFNLSKVFYGDHKFISFSLFLLNYTWLHFIPKNVHFIIKWL